MKNPLCPYHVIPTEAEDMKRKSKRIVRNQLEIGNVGKAINHLDSQVIPSCLCLRKVIIYLNKANNMIRDGNYKGTLPTHLSYIEYTDKGVYAIRNFSPPRMKQLSLIAFAAITAFIGPNVISELGLSGYMSTATDLVWGIIEQFMDKIGIALP